MIESRRFGEALQLVQTALPLVSERNQTTTADLWAQAGMANLQLNQPADAEEAYGKARALYQELKATKAEAAVTMNLGTALLLQQRDGEAATAFVQAAEIWQGLNSRENVEYCKLAEAAVRLDERIAALSNAGHATRDPEQQRAAAREMVALYPDLIATYEKIGARRLAAAFCASAASTARFAGDVDSAIDWYRQAATSFHQVGLPSRARGALSSAEDLLRQWANALMQKQEMAEAVPVLLQLAEVYRDLGQPAQYATSMLNAAIGLLQTSQQYADARQLAEQAAALFDSGSDDLAMAQKVIAFCDSNLKTG
jgi:tetratricopeptide (TPR) repeat protein